MKKCILIILLAGLIAGCGTKTQEPTVPEETILSSASEETATISTIEEVDREVKSITFTAVTNDEKASQHAEIEAFYDNNELAWVYESEEVYIAQLENLEDLGFHGDGYFLNVDGKIVKISVEGENAGKVEWINEEYQGASSSHLFTEDINGDTLLYVGGYFGPDFMIIDNNGNTLERIEAIQLREVDNRGAFYWLYSMAWNGTNIDLLYGSNEATVTFNPKTGETVDVVYCDSVTINGANEYRISPLERNWTEADNSVLEWRIEVLGTINQEIVTSIDVNSIYFPTDANEILSEEDFNCDGLKDLMIYGGSLGTHGDQHFFYFINTGSEYVECEGFYDLSEPTWDEDENLISSISRDSAASYYRYLYKIEDDKPVLVKEEHYVYDESYDAYVLE